MFAHILYCYTVRNFIYTGSDKMIQETVHRDKMTYTETENELTDTVTLRTQKHRGAGSIYIKPDFFERIELPRDASLKITYLKNEKKIIIESL